MASEELKRRKREEYEMQLFGFHSRGVFTAIQDRILENVDYECNKLAASIEKKCKLDTDGLVVLENNTSDLKSAYRENMKPYLKNIEEIVSKFICIPKHVLLEGDECQTTQYTEDEYNEMENELKDLQQRIKQATLFNAALTNELEILDEAKSTEDEVERICSVIENAIEIPELDARAVVAVESLKELKGKVDAKAPITQKDIYNSQVTSSLKEFEFDL